MSPRAKKILLVLGIIGLFVGSLFFSLGYFLRSVPGRTNILALGMAGGDYPASDLTDTIIFISLNHQTSEVDLLSLPRDIWVPALRTKINAVYHYRGLEGTKEVVAEIVGQPVDYGLLVNFDLFKEIIDALGGVEVDIERSFDDYRFPLPGKENDPCGGDPEYQCRYEHIHFDAGKQVLDGEMALKYIRSRYAEGEEGTDFARAARQQRLLASVRNKILSPAFLLDPRRAIQLIKVFLANIETDIPQEKYVSLAKAALRFNREKLQMVILGEDYLVNPPASKERYDGQWVLIPRAGDWQAVQAYVQEILEVD